MPLRLAGVELIRPLMLNEISRRPGSPHTALMLFPRDENSQYSWLFGREVVSGIRELAAGWVVVAV